jgi:uncharacterized membrane protein
MVLSFSKNHILLHILVIYLKTLNLNFLFFSKKKTRKKEEEGNVLLPNYYCCLHGGLGFLKYPITKVLGFLECSLYFQLRITMLKISYYFSFLFIWFLFHYPQYVNHTCKSNVCCTTNVHTSYNKADVNFFFFFFHFIVK